MARIAEIGIAPEAAKLKKLVDIWVTHVNTLECVTPAVLANLIAHIVELSLFWPDECPLVETSKIFSNEQLRALSPELRTEAVTRAESWLEQYYLTKHASATLDLARDLLSPTINTTTPAVTEP